jgi:hypothetical protein
MKRILLITVGCVLFSTLMVAQSVGINNNTPDTSAILDIKSDTKGMLIPRTSSSSRIAIVNPAKGLMLYDTTTSSFWFYNGDAWTSIADGSNTWNLSGNTGINPANHFIGTTDDQPLRFKVNNTWAGEIHPTSGNVFFGLGAGQSNMAGQANTAIGEHSLFTNTAGTSNSAYGAYALNSNTTGSENTGSGSLALFFNTTGSENTASGGRALYNNTTGTKNTASGNQALVLNTTGNENTANGYRSLFSNTTGSFNTASGVDALLYNTIGSNNTAYGYQALYFNTTGNGNAANGNQALYSNTTGSDNTANGYKALFSNTNGNGNAANGYQALYSNTTGSWNTANGYGALYNNTTGYYNAANGYQALLSNVYGYSNTATGEGALRYNTFGSFNTATGESALRYNTIGGGNTANGYQALYNNTGSYNTANGYQALSNNIGGFNNIAIGDGSGTASYAPDVYNTISIGNDDILNGYQNQAFIGNTRTGWIGGKVTWSTYSDARIKNTVTEDVKGLDFILRLRPVTYHISNKAITALTGNKDTPDFPGKYDNEKVKYTGFIAQEVEQAAKAVGYDFSGYAAPKNQWGLYSISYEQFVVPLVKAMQEQQSIIEEMKKEMAEMKKEIELSKK